MANAPILNSTVLDGPRFPFLVLAISFVYGFVDGYICFLRMLEQITTDWVA